MNLNEITVGQIALSDESCRQRMRPGVIVVNRIEQSVDTPEPEGSSHNESHRQGEKDGFAAN